VDSVSNNGQIVKLEDGSIWEIDPLDTIDTMLWLPTTRVVTFSDNLINTDNNETAFAIQIRLILVLGLYDSIKELMFIMHYRINGIVFNNLFIIKLTRIWTVSMTKLFFSISINVLQV
jgi:hypothetical protein